ncbi:protein O-mannosyl-transferase TMTC2-like [Oscarella lobularis]|uniref:protein O-mannosyl-transferase TMTC2-like n=1 Tax=Oscarella lobularis TaxID=121494 RepID=UPI0033133CC6
MHPAPSTRKRLSPAAERLPETPTYYRRSIFILSCLVYANTLAGELVFDDHEAIVTNRDVRPSTPLKTIFANDFWGVPLRSNDSHKSYRPLTTLTFRWNYAVHGLEPWGYHAFNVVLHAAVATLLFGTCSILFRSEKASFPVALLFALHPIHTEAVAGVVGRADLLAALFYLFAFRAYVKGLEGGRGSVSYGWLCVMALCAGCSTLCKETGITVLASCAVYDLFYACDLEDAWEIVSLILKIYFLAGGVATSFVESDNPTLFDPDWTTRFQTYSYLCAFNAWLLLYPSGLCYDWSMDSIPRIKTLGDIRNLCTILAALGLAVLVLYGLFWRQSTADGSSSEPNGSVQNVTIYKEAAKKRKLRFQRRIVVIGLCLTIAPFIPASNLFFPVGFVIAERVLYIPSIGFCVLVGLGLETTIQRNSEWLDTKSLAESGIKVNPNNAKVHLTLGNYLAQNGLRACERSYREAIRLRPHYAAAWTNLGLVLLNTERPEEAEEAYRTALKHKPASADASTNYGHLCRIQERWKEADTLYRIALKKRPHDPGLNYNLGLVNEEMEKLDIAEGHYEHVLRVEPSHADAAFRLAHLLATTTSTHVRLKSNSLAVGKRAEKAESVYRSALQYRSDYVDGWISLGELLLHNNDLDDAEMAFRRATGLDSAQPSAYLLLGKTMERKGVTDEAAKAYRTTLQLDPSNTQAKQLLANLF